MPMTASGMIIRLNGRAVWMWWRVCCPIRPQANAQSSGQFSRQSLPAVGDREIRCSQGIFEMSTNSKGGYAPSPQIRYQSGSKNYAAAAKGGPCWNDLSFLHGGLWTLEQTLRAPAAFDWMTIGSGLRTFRLQRPLDRFSSSSASWLSAISRFSIPTGALAQGMSD